MATKSATPTAPNATRDERRWIERHAEQLSPTTLRAKWVHEPGERPDRNGQTLATRSREVIRRWAEERRGTPVAATKDEANGRPRTLRIDFPGGSSGGTLKPVSWDDWFAVFEERDLVFLFQERLRNGDQSNFFRLDSPDRERG